MSANTIPVVDLADLGLFLKQILVLTNKIKPLHMHRPARQQRTVARDRETRSSRVRRRLFHRRFRIP